MSVTGIVLAGGRSSRFGGEKLSEELNGSPILTLAIEALATVADEILLAGSRLEASFPGAAAGRRPAVRLVVDAQPFAGPLAALAGCLEAASGEAAIVVGGDMPRLVPGVLRAMVERREARSVEAVVLDARGSPEPRGNAGDALRQVFPLVVDVRSARRAAREALGGGQRSMRAMLEGLVVDAFPHEEWRLLDPAGATLLDVDTPSDLERVRAAQEPENPR